MKIYAIIPGKAVFLRIKVFLSDIEKIFWSLLESIMKRMGWCTEKANYHKDCKKDSLLPGNKYKEPSKIFKQLSMCSCIMENLSQQHFLISV